MPEDKISDSLGTEASVGRVPVSQHDPVFYFIRLGIARHHPITIPVSINRKDRPWLPYEGSFPLRPEIAGLPAITSERSSAGTC